jgi:hypothetical protein
MAYFDRFDICEAYAALESDYNMGGWLHERPSNRRRSEATHVQLHRLKFKLSPLFNGFVSLTDNGKEIYSDLVSRYNLPTADNEELHAWRTETALQEEGAI